MGPRGLIAGAIAGTLFAGLTTVGLRASEKAAPEPKQDPVKVAAVEQEPKVEELLVRLEQQGTQSTEIEPQRAVTVVGTGSVKAAPDVGHVSVGVQVRNPSAGIAWRQANIRAARVVRSLRSNGVDDADIRTSELSLWRNRDRYYASNQVSVTIRNLERAGEIIGEAAAAGGEKSRVYGMSFSIDDTEELLREARRKAIEDAIARAKQYARAAEVELGRVLAISEGSSSRPSYDYDDGYGFASFGAVPALPYYGDAEISSGESTVATSVTMIFALR